MSGPLSNLLSSKNVKTAVPLIKDNSLVPLRLKSLIHERIEKGDVIKWEFVTTGPVDQNDGGQIMPGSLGSMVFQTTRFYGKDGPEAAVGRAMQEVSRYIDALLGTADQPNPKGKPERPELLDQAAAAQGVLQLDPAVVASLVGQTLLATIKVKTGDFVGNEISRVYFPADKGA